MKADLGGDPDIYLVRVDWAPDGKALYAQRLTRAQDRLDMLRIDPETGASTVAFSERAAARSWINVTDNYRLLKDGSILWWSERDGFGHLYRFADGHWTQLTNGRWVVQGLLGVDEAHHRLIYRAAAETVLEPQLYALDYLSPGSSVQLTENRWSNDGETDKAATRILVTRSSPGQPPQVYLADAGNGHRIAWIEQNRLGPDHPYAPYLAGHRPTQFGTLAAADGTTLHWKMITPPLVPGKRYPVFFSHYGGPHSQVVAGDWGGALKQYWVDKGYIWFELDNRGAANRGTAFENPIWHAMGGVEVADQIAGARWLQTQPFVDPRRIATFGWSYGGYMTLKLLEAAPGLFAAGIAVAPVTRWELYDTAYTERYMGDPTRDASAYAAASALPKATAIRDPLLVIHGLADDNVVFQNSTELLATLQEGKVPFELMVYPGKAHGIPGPNTQVHLYETIERFLDRSLTER